jgi:hypothetical protein
VDDDPDNPVKVETMWQATCDACGWHTAPATPLHAVNEWAQVHLATCPAVGGSDDAES